jgi:hypothetical protein
VNSCALANPLEAHYGCSGRLEWHHAIKQQRLKREFKHGAVIWLDPGSSQRWVPAFRTNAVREDTAFRRTLDSILGDTRNRVWLCSHHHELVTNGRLEPPLPDEVWEFADEFGLTAQLENDLARRNAA